MAKAVVADSGPRFRELATAAIQATERLTTALRKGSAEADATAGGNLAGEAERALWLAKMQLEGSSPDYPCEFLVEGKSHGKLVPSVSGTALSPVLPAKLQRELAGLLAQTSPTAMARDHRLRLQEVAREFVGQQGGQLHGVYLEACPWHHALSPKAARTSVYVAFERTRRLLSCEPVLVQAQRDSFELGPGIACRELREFLAGVLSGRPRCVELVFCPAECVVFETEAMARLRTCVLRDAAAGGAMRCLPAEVASKFVESARGQGISAAFKKSSKGLVVSGDAGAAQLCTALRLFDHAESVKAGEGGLLVWGHLHQAVGGPDPGRRARWASEALALAADGVGTSFLERLRALATACRDELNGLIETGKHTRGVPLPKDVLTVPRAALLATRTATLGLSPRAPRDASELEGLRATMAEIGPPLSNIDPRRVLFIAQVGSGMYGLSVKGSDTDYIAVYSRPTADVLSQTKYQKVESQSNQGKKLEVEHRVYEARLFCEMLLKGNHSNIELLFVDAPTYASPLWERLCRQRHRLMSEIVVRQYRGFVTEHLRRVKVGKTPERDQKNLYHVFHKLGEYERLARGGTIAVATDGEERDFILDIRRQAALSPLLRQTLITLAEEKLHHIDQLLLQRTWRHPEVGDAAMLDEWLLEVRKDNLWTESEGPQ